jgi:hypothetical protein
MAARSWGASDNDESGASRASSQDGLAALSANTTTSIYAGEGASAANVGPWRAYPARDPDDDDNPKAVATEGGFFEWSGCAWPEADEDLAASAHARRP